MINEWRGRKEMEEKVDASKFARKMLEWEEKRNELLLLEGYIKSYVFGLQKTQVVGNVKAKYSSGRKAYDYAGAAVVIIPTEQLPILFDKYTTETVVVKTDWRSICDEGEIGKDSISYTQGDPSVSLVLE